MQEQDVKWLIKQQEIYQNGIEMAVDRIHDREEGLKVIQDILKRISGYQNSDDATQRELIGHVDKTIEKVCGRIQRMEMSPERYLDTVKALAELVRARALLD